MTIACVLAGKGRDVVTSRQDATLVNIAALLAAKKIGAVVIVDSAHNILGIASERDIIRAIAKDGSSALDDAVASHMTWKVSTTTEEESVHSALERMTHGRFRHLPVVKDGKLAGLVSIGDIVKYRLAQIEHEHEAMREYIATA